MKPISEGWRDYMRETGAEGMNLMHSDDTRGSADRSISDFLIVAENSPMVAIRGTRRTEGAGPKFLKRNEGARFFFLDPGVARQLGERACEVGGLHAMRALWEQLYERNIFIGDNWNGVGGWYQ